MGLLNKIYGLASGVCLFVRRQIRAIRSGSTRVPHFNDGEVEMVLFVRVDDIFAHAQAMRKRLAAEFREKIK